jgi:hypothetical protein
MSLLQKAAGALGSLGGAASQAWKSGITGGAFRGTVYGMGAGAALGGIYGAASDNTSVLGGMTAGALGGSMLGGAGGWLRSRRGAITSGGIMNTMRSDAGIFGRTMRRGYNTWRSMSR